MNVKFFATTIDTGIELLLHFDLHIHNMYVEQVSEEVTRLSDGVWSYDVWTESIREVD